MNKFLHRFKRPSASRQEGASLIEVLVAILILSFGMLALGGMMAYAVQMPKLAGYRSTAMQLAAGHIERMRANVNGYTSAGGNAYVQSSTYGATIASATDCASAANFNCTAATLAALDNYRTSTLLRRDLPFGTAGFQVSCVSGNCDSQEGEIWVMWQEPTNVNVLSANSSDECPASVAAGVRCVHLKFRL